MGLMLKSPWDFPMMPTGTEGADVPWTDGVLALVEEDEVRSWVVGYVHSNSHDAPHWRCVHSEAEINVIAWDWLPIPPYSQFPDEWSGL